MIVSIRTKLFIALFLACLTAIIGMASIIQYNFSNSFLDYLNEQENRSLAQVETQLIEHYQMQKNWDIVQRDNRTWEKLLHSAVRSSLFPVDGSERNEHRPPPPEFELGGLPPPRSHMQQRIDRYVGRVVLLDEHKQLIRGNSQLPIPKSMRRLLIEKQTIGYLGLYPRQRLTEKIDLEFAARLQHTLWIVGLVTLLVAAAISYYLARHLGRPIQALRQGARQLASGSYGVRMPLQGRDELAQLTHDFNQLAERLQQNEVSRKQWIADIAHELRTPLAILRGEIEAMQDGIIEPDATTLFSLHQEALHLQRLVSDLYELSMSDSGALSYRKQPINLTALLQETLALYSTTLQEQHLRLESTGINPLAATVNADAQRIQQLFKNILENTLRYTDKPGALRVSTHVHNGTIDIFFQDSAPSVPAEALPRLFERLYRVDASRNRATGGAGIGLSLCRNIVEAHHGTITAASSALGGLEIRVTLPLEK